MLATSLIPIFIVSVLLVHYGVAQTVCATGEKPFRLEVLYDNFPSQTSWFLKDTCDQASIVEGNGGSTLPNTLFTTDACLKDGRGYSFAIYDTVGNGR